MALGGVLELTYRFQVAPDAKIAGGYVVFVHLNREDGTTVWNDAHTLPEGMRTSQCKPGQLIEYTRTRFIPTFSYIGPATFEVGLYREDERLPLSGPQPADRDSSARAYRVGTVEAGIVPVCAEVTVSADAPAELELREPDGGDLELIAVDGDGRPLPFVRWDVRQASGVAWFDLDGTVQRIDPWTDALGRRLPRHVEPGTVRVTASYGHRTVRADAVVTEGRATPLRLVLQ